MVPRSNEYVPIRFHIRHTRGGVRYPATGEPPSCPAPTFDRAARQGTKSMRRGSVGPLSTVKRAELPGKLHAVVPGSPVQVGLGPEMMADRSDVRSGKVAYLSIGGTVMALVGKDTAGGLEQAPADPLTIPAGQHAHNLLPRMFN